MYNCRIWMLKCQILALTLFWEFKTPLENFKAKVCFYKITLISKGDDTKKLFGITQHWSWTRGRDALNPISWNFERDKTMNIWAFLKFIWNFSWIPTENARLGGIHKLRKQDFANFWPPSPLRKQVYYVSLCSSISIWLTLPPP